jgi:mono/diheme cytochrome c family protein
LLDRPLLDGTLMDRPLLDRPLLDGTLLDACGSPGPRSTLISANLDCLMSLCSTNGVALLVLVFCGGAVRAQSVEAARKLKNPISYSRKSIAQGKSVFARYCTSCHGPDGKSEVDVVADATDLTAPKGWKNGTTDGEIFRSIRDGQGASMPSFRTQIRKEEDLWHLVNFVRSLWPAETRPPLEDDKTK